MKKNTGPLRVGVVGCGAISNAYFHNLAPYAEYAKITACSDIDVARAQAKAAEHKVPTAYSVKELLNDPEIDIVLNLTIPAAHADVNMQALKAGKHAYCEKPFSLTYKDGLKVANEAKKRKLRVGCAPDTVLGGGIQTCRKVIDAGLIGKPIGATANMMGHGVETWHPNPEFYYKAGGGPLFDMGPYYLTSLITMLGPVKSVSALAKKAFKERHITSQPFAGKVIKVDVPTHLIGAVDFANGTAATVTMSFDVWAHNQPLIEIYGTEGSLRCPDPNGFGGEVHIWTPKTNKWDLVPLTHNGDTGRGIGLADMAYAIINRKNARASGELALHVVEIMEGFHVSADSGKAAKMKSTCTRPDAMKEGLPVGKL